MVTANSVSATADKLIEKLSRVEKITPVVAKNWHVYVVPESETVLQELTSTIGQNQGLTTDKINVIRTTLQSLQAALYQFLNIYPKPERIALQDRIDQRCATQHEMDKAIFVQALPSIPLRYFAINPRLSGYYHCLDEVTDTMYVAPQCIYNHPTTRIKKAWDETKYVRH